MAGIPPLVGINVQLALARRGSALDHMDALNTKLRNSGFNLDPAGPPYWDRATWEAFKAQFGEYPYNSTNKPPDVQNAPAWVKQLCGVALNPAERMGGGQV